MRRVFSLLLVVAAVSFAARGQGSDELVFGTLEVWIDAEADELGAWQLELRDPSERARFSAVEGGEPAAFAEAPTYDPAALVGGRLILAAYAAEGEEPPTGLVRVARLHYARRGEAPVAFDASFVAADGRGRRRTFELDLRNEE